MPFEGNLLKIHCVTEIKLKFKKAFFVFNHFFNFFVIDFKFIVLLTLNQRFLKMFFSYIYCITIRRLFQIYQILGQNFLKGCVIWLRLNRPLLFEVSIWFLKIHFQEQGQNNFLINRTLWSKNIIFLGSIVLIFIDFELYHWHLFFTLLVKPTRPLNLIVMDKQALACFSDFTLRSWFVFWSFSSHFFSFG